MIRLGICAFWAFVITSMASHAQDAQVAAGGLLDDSPVLIGHDKTPLPCPTYCVPQRVTSPAQATVGERDVLAYALATA